jgi:hypothetical protein
MSWASIVRKKIFKHRRYTLRSTFWFYLDSLAQRHHSGMTVLCTTKPRQNMPASV